MFPNALIECIFEGRLPRAEEVEGLSTGWRQCISFATFSADEIIAMAHLALGGQQARRTPAAC
jgi:hypothetical protein